MKVLSLSPHTDDIELACGGYLTKLHEQGHEIYVVAFCKYYDGLDLTEEWSVSVSHVADYVDCLDFELRLFGDDRQEILETLISKRSYEPDLVLIPSSSDVHQDHKVIHEEAVRAFGKDHSVLAYEFPWNCRGFRPNYFAELKQKHLTGKWRMLDCYDSQKHRTYFDRKLIDGWARMRGQQIKKEFAEAFEVITWID